MTAQIGEILIYNGKENIMESEPLNEYIFKLKKEDQPKFPIRETACWRGYCGKWEIKDNKLYLIGLEIQDYIGVKSGVGYIFPGQEQVFAEWYTGLLSLPQGELLEYVHLGYESIYEENLILEIKNGVLVGKRIIDNRAKANRELTDSEKDNVKDIEEAFEEILKELKKKL
jgi:hypothetical protein